MKDTVDRPRLIERAFCLRQASLDSVHEKNVRHGHISTLHIWPARRPLAACRAALIATLLPDPESAEERRRLLEKIGGTVVKRTEKKKLGDRTVVVEREETIGGILHWGRESNPDLEWFRGRIREEYGGRAPRVLDPFAGGGAIPLEAMRLGCDVTAADINPVAWFILKCTLEYPQKLAGQHRPLPGFALESPEFMEGFFKGTGKLTGRELKRHLEAVQARMFPAPDVDLSWHVRAWGWWVLQRAKAELARFYPTLDGKPTVAYLWARTVKCKNCRTLIPLLKTRWLCRKDKKRILLRFEPKPDMSGVGFGIEHDVPLIGGNAAQRREHDRRVGQGTMSRSGAWCPCCGSAGTVAMEMEDIRHEGLAGRLGAVMTSVVVDGENGKEYRLPAPEEVHLAEAAGAHIERVFAGIPFGVPDEPLPAKEALGFRVPLYGFDRWSKLFTQRQLIALGSFVKHARAAAPEMLKEGYPSEWLEALRAYSAVSIDRLVDRSSILCRPDPTPTQSGVINTFSRFALPITWDFIEGVTTESFSGGFSGAVEWVAKVVAELTCLTNRPQPTVLVESLLSSRGFDYDLIVTDPPYYDSIPYSDLMDFFYVWLRRTLIGVSSETDAAFATPLGPKWDHERNDGELIDDSSRHGGDKSRSKAVYEDGMFRAFRACYGALKPDGLLVIVFAHKDPDAWETLVSAIIKAGFVVDGSWPIQTEMGNRTRALGSAALSSSVWLVCRKRAEDAPPGWDNRVLAEMRESIQRRLREFWDAGIRGPDFVWAATGPALEAYSRHPVVKKANEQGMLLEVPEFLRSVRRMVVDFVVGRVLSRKGEDSAISGLDDVTTYYLLHRKDFGFDEAPIGACILYAVSCGLSDRALEAQYDLLVRTGEGRNDGAEQPSDEEDAEEKSGSRVRLRVWNQRRSKTLGHDTNGVPAPLVDQLHRLMLLWRSGNQARMDEYIESRALRQNALFHQLLQALIELAQVGSEERSLLESISNHLGVRGTTVEGGPRLFPAEAADVAD